MGRINRGRYLSFPEMTARQLQTFWESRGLRYGPGFTVRLWLMKVPERSKAALFVSALVTMRKWGR